MPGEVKLKSTFFKKKNVIRLSTRITKISLSTDYKLSKQKGPETTNQKTRYYYGRNFGFTNLYAR